MTTNLLAAIVVALSTNTVERITGYARHESDWEAMRGTTHAIHIIKGVDPNEKTITTTAKRTTTLTFDWMGKAQSVEHVEVLWESNKVVRLEWREVRTVFRTPMSDDWSLHGTMTNRIDDLIWRNSTNDYILLPGRIK